jgi:outer membrane protein assembly factor BamB
MNLTRRVMLSGIVAGLGFRPARPWAQEPAQVLPVLARRSTANTRLAPLTGAGDRLLFCGDQSLGVLAAADLSVQWQAPLGLDTPADFRPRLGDGVVVCGGRSWLAGHDLASGRRLWLYPATIQTGVPLVSASQVFFGDGHRITALDLRTGAVLWRFDGVPDTLASYAPAASDDTVFCGPGDGRLYALDRKDGRLRWSRDGREDWQYLRQISVEGDLVVAGTYKETLVGLTVQEGATRWSFNAGNFINSQLVRDGVAYLWSPTGWIYAISTRSGAVLWRYQTTDFDGTAGNWGSILAELATQGDQLCVLDMQDVLHLLDRATGQVHRAVSVPDRIRHAVLPLDGEGFAFPTLSAEILLTGPA